MDLGLTHIHEKHDSQNKYAQSKHKLNNHILLQRVSTGSGKLHRIEDINDHDRYIREITQHYFDAYSRVD